MSSLYEQSTTAHDGDLLVRKFMKPGQAVELSAQSLSESDFPEDVIERFMDSTRIDLGPGLVAQGDWIKDAFAKVYGDTSGRGSERDQFDFFTADGTFKVEVKNFNGIRAPVMIFTNTSDNDAMLVAGILRRSADDEREDDFPHAILSDGSVCRNQGGCLV